MVSQGDGGARSGRKGSSEVVPRGPGGGSGRHQLYIGTSASCNVWDG
jgi:hypothetical protein